MHRPKIMDSDDHVSMQFDGDSSASDDFDLSDSSGEDSTAAEDAITGTSDATESDATENCSPLRTPRRKRRRIRAFSPPGPAAHEILFSDHEPSLLMQLVPILIICLLAVLGISMGVSLLGHGMGMNIGGGSGSYLRLEGIHTTRSRVIDVGLRAYRLLNWQITLANTLKCSHFCFVSLVERLTPFIELPRSYSAGFLNPDNPIGSFLRRPVQYFRDHFERKHADYIQIRGGPATSGVGGRPRAVNPSGEIITGMQRLAHGAHFAMQQEGSDLSMGTLVHQMEHFSWSVYQSLSYEYLHLPDGQERLQLWLQVPACIRSHFPADVVIYGAIDGTLQVFGEHCTSYPDLYGAYYNGRKGKNHGYKFNQQLAFDLVGRLIFASWGGVGHWHDAHHYRETELYTNYELREWLTMAGKHKMLADTGYIGVDSDLLFTNIKEGQAVTEAQKNLQSMVGYLRSIAENGIGAMERTFTIMRQPPTHSHWALPPRIGAVCGFLYNFYREHSLTGHIAEARLGNLNYMLAEYILP